MARALEKVVACMERIAPTKYAGSWDNVGLLVDTLREDAPRPATVFLTCDLTEKVVDEAAAASANVIVAYHPTPFRSFKTLRRSDPTSRIVLKCVTQGMAVYSPHTALDAAPEGITDWLIAPFATGATQRPIKPLPPAVDPAPGAGIGRIVELGEPRTLADCVQAVKQHLGLRTVRVAPAAAGGVFAAAHVNADAVAARGGEVIIRSVGACCGSGREVLDRCGADLWLTGELGHHDVLAANAQGASVILTEHSNSERGFLPRLAERLGAELRKDGAAEGDFRMVVSQLDSDPLVAL
eukprot:TRINITY_DN70532_c0_g1_i1.p1 TRINITY_DN70532_c0_g1~~TRINITY_DN70532_c0_g1_i1.p1  ORF type:complete len:321 (+),score=104.62 TRINITY_DN70532_c0_g1_i1:76-963(+)